MIPQNAGNPNEDVVDKATFKKEGCSWYIFFSVASNFSIFLTVLLFFLVKNVFILILVIAFYFVYMFVSLTKKNLMYGFMKEMKPDQQTRVFLQNMKQAKCHLRMDGQAFHYEHRHYYQDKDDPVHGQYHKGHLTLHQEKAVSFHDESEVAFYSTKDISQTLRPFKEMNITFLRVRLHPTFLIDSCTRSNVEENRNIIQQRISTKDQNYSIETEYVVEGMKKEICTYNGQMNIVFKLLLNQTAYSIFTMVLLNFVYTFFFFFFTVYVGEVHLRKYVSIRPGVHFNSSNFEVAAFEPIIYHGRPHRGHPLSNQPQGGSQGAPLSGNGGLNSQPQPYSGSSGVTSGSGTSGIKGYYDAPQDENLLITEHQQQHHSPVISEEN